MANPIFQIVPQIIQRAVSGTCYACCHPALYALKAAVAKHQQGALKKNVAFQVVDKDIVIFGACLKHQLSLSQFRASLLMKDYHFTVPK